MTEIKASWDSLKEADERQNHSLKQVAVALAKRNSLVEIGELLTTQGFV